MKVLGPKNMGYYQMKVVGSHGSYHLVEIKIIPQFFPYLRSRAHAANFMLLGNIQVRSHRVRYRYMSMSRPFIRVFHIILKGT